MPWQYLKLKQSNPFTCGVLIPPNPLRYRSFFVDSFKKIGDTKGVYARDSVMAAAAEEEEPTSTPTTVETSLLFLTFLDQL
jgi:hypothetical protein